MVSLIDIAKVKLPPVPIRGAEVEVNGLTADHIAGIMYDFPEIRKLLSTQAADKDMLSSLLARLPEAAAMLIAAGTGKPGDKETIDFARTLGVGEQYDLLEAILKATFPRGVKSFLDGVQAAMEQSGAHGWAQDMKLPGLSSPASEPAAVKETAGTAPPSS
jgi:hypothetical protein